VGLELGFGFGSGLGLELGKSMSLTVILDNPTLTLTLTLNPNSNPNLDGLVMQPQRGTYRENQWLVIFCDEINLPEEDAYGSQRVIMFLRQLTGQGWD
jgi:hypothetical protein